MALPDAAEPKAASIRKQKKKHKKQKSGVDNSAASYFEVKETGVVIEYVTTGIDENDPLFDTFSTVFSKFQPKEVERAPSRKQLDSANENNNVNVEKRYEEPTLNNEEKPLSRKKRKQLKRLDVAQLKQLVPRPDVVEMHDASAADPKMLIFLKSYRNTIPVPKHWSLKKKFLQGKRGIDREPFALPAFIADTGIAKIRENYVNREEMKKQKHKAKDRMNPKMGRIDIDYQVLHDAFFKYQTKPKMSKFGDVYYEGREYEVKLPDHRAGHLSERLKKALGMPDGAPPPWLINMQRYGPPPAYPTRKIPGLNAPIPPGASFGYHPGGWGKPPVDEHGQPLYGDVFGVDKDEHDREPVNDKLWGEMEDKESEIEEDDIDAVGGVEDVDEGGFSSTAPPLSEAGLTETTESATGTDTGTETPDIVQLKKFSTRDEDKKLYQTLDIQKAHVGSAVMGSAYTYVVPKGSDVEVSLNPGELEQYQDSNLVQEKYDKAMEDATARMRTEREGVQEVFNEETRKRARKANNDSNKGGKGKAHKSFKF